MVRIIMKNMLDAKTKTYYTKHTAKGRLTAYILEDVPFFFIKPEVAQVVLELFKHSL